MGCSKWHCCSQTICTHLKQIGLGLHNYHQTNDKFPMGESSQLDNNRNGPYGWECWSAHACMLNYLEQSAVYNAINFSICPDNGGGGSQPPAATVYNTLLNIFLCPSDPKTGTGGNTNNYYASFGTTTQWGSPMDTTGLFTVWKAYGIRDCTDGTSNTIAFSEGIGGFGGNSRAGQNPPQHYRGNFLFGSIAPTTANLYDVTSAGALAVQADVARAAAAFNSATSNIADYRGWRWSIGCSGFTMFNTVQLPNEANFNGYRNGCGPGCNMDASWSVPASSWHTGGVNALMADGSVRFIKNTINRVTWFALGTKGNGEVVSADSY